jgi:hypothetical protein
MATSLGLPGLNGPSVNSTPVEKVGYWQHQYRRYGPRARLDELRGSGALASRNGNIAEHIGF